MDNSDGNPFNPYETSYDNFLRYMNVPDTCTYDWEGDPHPRHSFAKTIIKIRGKNYSVKANSMVLLAAM